ncbi:MAG: hypothetical protein WAO58_01870 [Fimbriimonadaceae bacterium]
MEHAIRKTVQVGDNGRIEIEAPELLPGTTADVILIVPEVGKEAELPLESFGGWAKGRIKILPGFDDPIPGMEEYA